MATADSYEARQHFLQAAINRQLEEALTKQFTEAAKPIINEAVRNAMADMQVGVKSFYSPQHMRDFVKVIIEDNRSKDNS